MFLEADNFLNMFNKNSFKKQHEAAAVLEKSKLSLKSFIYK